MFAAAMVAAFVAISLHAQTTAPSDDDGLKSLRRAIAQLTEEARVALKNQSLPRDRANFAREFAGQPDSLAVAHRLLRPVNSDAFIDAYVRWQLTSFEPPVILPSISERNRFSKALDDLPALQGNPWADSRTIDQLMAVSRRGRLSDADATAVSKRLDDLTAAAAATGDLNRAALGLRAYLLLQLHADKPAQLRVALERCRAMIDAGWSVAEEKAKLEAMFTEAGRSGTMTDEQLRIVSDAASELIGRKRPFIGSARLQDNTLIVDLSVAAVDDFDVRWWIRRLSVATP